MMDQRPDPAPRATLIMPVRNEAAYLPIVLESLARQRFDHARLRLIAIDGESPDGSAEIIRLWLAASDISGIVLTNPAHTIPTSLNLGMRHADPATFLIRLDSHTIYEERYISSIMEAYETAAPTIGCVGGPQTPAEPESFGEAVVASLMCNPMGLGGAAFRTASTPRTVDHVYLGAWRPGVLQSTGGFDERWRANEDSELSLRVRKQGWEILWVPLQARYRIKRGPLDTVRQWSRYGYWRAQTLLRHPHAWRPRHLAPPLALLGALALALSPFRLALLAAFALYAALVLARRPRTESIGVSLVACFFFPICQGAYAAGLISGLLAGAFGKATATGTSAS
jgi:succinoglycan biosynthesis protein ExoA